MKRNVLICVYLTEIEEKHCCSKYTGSRFHMVYLAIANTVDLTSASLFSVLQRSESSLGLGANYEGEDQVILVV